MPRIVTVTMNPTMDVSGAVDHVMPDRKLRCSEPRYEPGGGGINVARAIRRLGGDPVAVYLSGHLFGSIVERLLEEQEEVATKFVRTGSLGRLSFAMNERQSDRQYRCSFPGPKVSEDDWKRALRTIEDEVEEHSFVVLSGSLPPGVPSDFYGRIAEALDSRNVRIVADTSGEALRQKNKNPFFLVKPNMNELTRLIGEPIQNEADQEKAARTLIDSGFCETVLLSLGAAGALLVTKDTKLRLRAPSVKVRSKVGAGDSMVGGVVFALSRDWSLVDAARFGICAGAAAVTTPGTELLHRKDTHELYEKLKKENAGE